MTDEQPTRPRQVTMAGWLIMGGSAAAVVSAFDQIARLSSLDTREAVERAIAEPPLSALDMGTQDVLDVMHVLILLVGACAATAAILGWYALRRHRTSRLVLSVLAFPLLVVGMVSGGFFTTLVATAVLLLWLPPSRAWFDGREPAPSPGSGATRAASGQPSGATSPLRPGTPPPTPAPPVTGAKQADDSPPRPPVILAAAIITWVFAGLTTIVMVAAVVLVAGDSEAVLEEALRQQPELSGQGLTPGLLTASVAAMAFLAVGWCAVAGVMALLACRGRAWARTTWLVLVAVAAGCLLLGSMLNVVLMVPMVGAAFTLSLLLRPEARAWFAPRR